MTRRASPPSALVPSPTRPLSERPLLAFAPVPRQTRRLDGWTPDRQRDFIEALAATGSVTAACTHSAYDLRRAPGAEQFCEAGRRAVDQGVERLEDVAMERA